MDTIREPRGEMIISRLSAKNIQTSELSIPVLIVCGTKRNCPLGIFLHRNKFEKKNPGKMLLENSTAKHFNN